MNKTKLLLFSLLVLGTTQAQVITSSGETESKPSLVSKPVESNVEPNLVLTCPDDTTVINPASQSEVETEFSAFLDRFSHNLASVISISFSVAINGYSGSFDPANWSTTEQSPGSSYSHSSGALSINTGGGGGGTTRTITIPSDGKLSFDWAGTFTGSGGYVLRYFINGVSTDITGVTGLGTITDVAVSAGDVFKLYTWGFTQNSSYSASFSNFSFESELPSATVVENGYVNTVAPNNWSTTEQSPGSSYTHSSSSLSINTGGGGGGTTRTITIPKDGKISFDWAGTFTGSGGYVLRYFVNGVSTDITGVTGSGTISDIAVSAGDVFKLYSWGFTQNSSYSASFTNFKYETSTPYLGAVAGFYASADSIDVTYTVISDTETQSCTKKFKTVNNTSVSSVKNSIEIQYYPNPTKNTVTLEMDQKGSLNIFSLDGKIMKTQLLQAGTNAVNLDGFKAGVYGFRVLTSDAVKTFTIIKQ